MSKPIQAFCKSKTFRLSQNMFGLLLIVFLGVLIWSHPSIVHSHLVRLETVAACPTIDISPPTLPAATAGLSYSQALTQSGGTGPVVWSIVTGGQLPAGLTLDSSGLLSGTTTAFGTFNFTVRVTDANGCTGERACTLIINPPCGTITIVGGPNPGIPLGIAYNRTFTTQGGNGPFTWTISTGVPPTGLSMSMGGIISGVPSVAGTFNFTIKVADAGGCIGTQAYTLTVVSCPNITITPASIPAGSTFTVYRRVLNSNLGSAFTISSGTLPPGLIMNNYGSQAQIEGVPTAIGTYSFTVRAAIPLGCYGEQNYTVTITANQGFTFHPLPTPVRLLETRSNPASLSGCNKPGLPILRGNTFTLPARTDCAGIPANATAITGNVTVVPLEAGYLTLFPGNATQPVFASSNFKAEEITNNAFTIGLSAEDGTFKIFTNATTEVVIDVTGYYLPPSDGGLYFHAFNTYRLFETRAGLNGCIVTGRKVQGTGDPDSNPSLDLEVPSTCIGSPVLGAPPLVLVGNATTVLPSSGGYLTLYPSDEQRPTVASSNYAGGDVINTPFTVKLGANGKFKVYTTATTDLVIDLVGYYSTAMVIELEDGGGLFNPLASPVRLIETRPNSPGFPLAGCIRPNAPFNGGQIYTQLGRGTCGIPATAQALVGNVTVINATAGGYLTLWYSFGTAPIGATSNYRFPVASGYNRQFILALGQSNGSSASDGKFKIYSQFQTDLVIDVTGYFAP